VVGTLGLQELPCFAGGFGGGLKKGSSRGLLLDDAADGAGGDFQSGAGEETSDGVFAFEARSLHGLNQVADGISDAAHGRDRFDERADGLFLRVGLDVLFPAGDGVLGEEESFGGLFSGEAFEVFDLEDLETLRWGVVGAVSFGDFAPACGEDGVALLGEVEPELEFLDLGVEGSKGVFGLAQAAEFQARGEAEEVASVAQGLEVVGVDSGEVVDPRRASARSRFHDRDSSSQVKLERSRRRISR